MGIDHKSISKGTYDSLIGRIPVSQTILRNTKLNLSLVPSSPALAGAQVELVGVEDRELMLRSALEPCNGRYDYVLIDCPPSLGILTINGLLAALSGVIIPVQCEYLALEGLTQLFQTLDRVRAGLFPELSIRGLVLTMYDGRTNLARDVVDEVHSHFAEKVFNTIIPRSVRLAEAPSHGLPISAYAAASAGAIAYRALAGELVDGDKGQPQDIRSNLAQVQ